MKKPETARIDREIIQRDALALVSGAGIAAERSMLVPLLCARARVERDAEENVEVAYLSPYGDWYVGREDIIRELRSHADFVPAFARPKAAPAKPREPNPFRRGPEFNLTEQMKLLKSDPATAARLRAAATEEANR